MRQREKLNAYFPISPSENENPKLLRLLNWRDIHAPINADH